MRSFLQLVRFPAVFTILADSAMGFLFAFTYGLGLAGPITYDLSRAPINWLAFAIVLAASVCFYWGGMILNDAVDTSRDLVMRPSRPIPCGEIKQATAYRLAIGFLVGGLILAVLLDVLNGQFGSASVPFTLVNAATIYAVGTIVSIILYNCILKFSRVAPFIMGACRSLNLLFAFAAGQATVRFYAAQNLELNLSATIPTCGWMIALTFGVYVAGITWFARFENPEETNMSWVNKFLALTVMVGGILLLIPTFQTVPETMRVPVFALQPVRWTLLVTVLALMIGTRALQALLIGTQGAIGSVVGYSLLTLIVLDGILISLVAGPYGAIGILVLLAPAIFCKQFMYID